MLIKNSFKPTPKKKTMTDDQVTREHNAKFGDWFKEKLTNEPLHPGAQNGRLLFALANGPACNIATFQAYDINGYTFFTKNKDKTSDYQNSGVTMMCKNEKGTGKTRFYGRIEEIWELNYSGFYRTAMFRVRWAKDVKNEHCYFISMVIPPTTQKLTSQNEPWVFAKDVDQCFFVTDPIRPSRVIVRRGKRKIVGMDGVAADEDYDQFGLARQEEENMDNGQPYVSRRIRTTLPTQTTTDDLPFKRKTHSMTVRYARAPAKKRKTTEKIVKC
jgi:hypothetical protein